MKVLPSLLFLLLSVVSILIITLSSSSSSYAVAQQTPTPQKKTTTGTATTPDASLYTRGVVYLDLVYTLATEESLKRDPDRNDHIWRINVGRSGFEGQSLAVNFALSTIDLSGYRRKASNGTNNNNNDQQLPSVPIYDNAVLMLYCDTTKFVDETGTVRDVPKDQLDNDLFYESNHGKNSVFGSNLCNTVDVFLKLPATGASRAQWVYQEVPSHLAKSADLLNFTTHNHRSQKSQGNFFKDGNGYLPSSSSVQNWDRILFGQKYCRDFYDECLFHAFSCSKTYQNTKIYDRSEGYPVYNLGSRFYPTTEFRNLWTAISSPHVAAVMPSEAELASDGPFGHRMSNSFINLETNAWLMTINRLPPTRMLEVHEPFAPSDQATIIMQLEAKPSTIQPEGFVFAGTLFSSAVVGGICLFLIICKAIVPRILYLRKIEDEGQEEALERIDGELIERFEKQRLAEERRNNLIDRLGRVTGAPLTPEDLEALEDWTKLPVGDMIQASIAEERKKAMQEKLASASDKFAAIPRVMFARALRLLDKSLFSTEIHQRPVEGQQEQQDDDNNQDNEKNNNDEEMNNRNPSVVVGGENSNTHENINDDDNQQHNNNKRPRNKSFTSSSTNHQNKNLTTNNDEEDDNIADASVFELFSDATIQTAGNVKTQISSTTTVLKNGVFYAGDLAIGAVSGAADFVGTSASKVVATAKGVFSSKKDGSNNQDGDGSKNALGNQEADAKTKEEEHKKSGIEVRAGLETLDILSPEDNRMNDRKDHEWQQREEEQEKDQEEETATDTEDQNQNQNENDEENNKQRRDDDDEEEDDIENDCGLQTPRPNNKNNNDDDDDQDPSGLSATCRPGNNNNENRRVILPPLNLKKITAASPKTISGLTIAAAAGASPHHENSRFFEAQVKQVNRNLAQYGSYSENLDQHQDQSPAMREHQKQHARSHSVGVSPVPNKTTVVQMTSQRRSKLAAAQQGTTVAGRRSVSRRSAQHNNNPSSTPRRKFHGNSSSNSNNNNDSNDDIANNHDIIFEDVLERHLQEDRRLLDNYKDDTLPRHSFDPFSTESRPEDVPHCRRCGEVLPFVDLFAPCNCTSTATRYIHRSCLEAERRIDAFSDGGRNAEFCFRCRICRARYRVAPSSISVFGSVPMKSPLAQTLNKLLNNPIAPMLAMWVMVWICGYLVKFISATMTLDYLGTDWSALRVYHWVLGAFFLLSFSLCEWSLRPFFEIFQDRTRRIIIMVVAGVAPILLGYIGHFLMKLVSSVAWTWESFFGLGVAIEFFLFAWIVPQLALFVAKGAGHLYDRLPLSVQRCLQKVVP